MAVSSSPLHQCPSHSTDTWGSTLGHVISHLSAGDGGGFDAMAKLRREGPPVFMAGGGNCPASLWEWAGNVSSHFERSSGQETILRGW